MNDPASSPDLLNELANDFAQRYRRGERPTLAEYTGRHPALAAEIRDLFPALAVIEEFGSIAPGGGGARVRGPTADGAAPRQLGEYRILREVARGGMGIVYEAVQESLGRHVALKVLPFYSVGDACQLERFRREARAAAMLHHTNIVPVFGVGEHDGVHYFAMQFIRGQTLDSVLRALRARCRHSARARGEPGGPDTVDEAKADPLMSATLAGALVTGRFEAAPDVGHASVSAPADPTPARSPAATTEVFGSSSDGDSRSDMPYFQSVARVGLQVVEALAYAHGQGVLHRDVKPANILLDTEGTAWVTDFGLAKADGSADLTEPGDFVGTLRYMAPERFRGESDPRSDVFSLGLTLYEMATLRPAFAAPERAQLIARMLHDEPLRPGAIDRHIPRDLETVILKAIAKEPARRYQTAAELAEDLRRFLADRPVHARQSRWPEQFVRWCRRNPALAFATTSAAALLLVTVAVLATGNVLIQREQKRTRAERDRAETARELAENRADEIRRGLEALRAANALLDRGRLLANDRRWDDAFSEFSKAIRLRPEHVSAWTQRSDLFTRLGLWDLAAEDCVGAFELREPDDSFPWHCFALLRLYAGDVDDYRRICRAMREHFNAIGNPHFDINMARVCALAPVADGERAALVEEAQALADARYRPSWYLYILGMVYYRAGQPERAIQTLGEFLREEQAAFKPIAYPLLAMAHHRLGQTAEARQALQCAAEAIERWTEDGYGQGSVAWAPHLGATGYWPIAWWDWLECQLSYREARILLGEGPSGDDPRLRVVRARAFAGLGQWDKADCEYTKALALRPADPQFLLETYRNRGHAAVHFSRWSEAAAEFARASALHPSDARLRSYLAIAHLGAGEMHAYRQACAAMVERCGATHAPEAANDIVGTCVIVADALPDMVRLLPLARLAATRHVGNSRMLGAAQYRAGMYEEAVKNLDKGARAYPLRADDWSFLAMAHHRLGHAEEALHCLAEAENWIEAADRNASDTSRSAWGNWENKVAYPILFLEAREFVDLKYPCRISLPSVPLPVLRP